MCMIGQSIPMLWIAAFLLSELNAFDASISRTPLSSSSWKRFLTAWIAASAPPLCPAHTWMFPALSMTSSEKICIATLLIILLKISPIPIGLHPGFLFSGSSLQPRNASRLVVDFLFSVLNTSIFSVHIVRANRAAASLHELAAPPYLFEARIRLQSSPSIPDGPAPPLVRAAAFCILSAVMLSNTEGWICSISPLNKIELSASCPTGCFSCRSCIVSSFSGRIPLSDSSVNSLIAAETLPCWMYCENRFATDSIVSGLDWAFRRFCIDVASKNNSSSLPVSHCSILLRRISALSFPFAFGVVFCKSRAGMSMSSFRATGRSAEFDDHAFISLVDSMMNCLPTAPDGSVKMFLLQNTTALYIVSISVESLTYFENVLASRIWGRLHACETSLSHR